MRVIENSVDIDRGPHEVFAFCSDMRTEPDWNPAVTSVTLLTPEPIGRGTRFAVRTRGAGTSTVEIVEFAPPSSWVAESPGGLSVRLVGRVEPRGDGGARLTVRLELRSTGPFRLVEPVVALLMRSTARSNGARVRQLLERRDPV